MWETKFHTHTKQQAYQDTFVTGQQHLMENMWIYVAPHPAILNVAIIIYYRGTMVYL
jgi:hypothetical protein